MPQLILLTARSPYTGFSPPSARFFHSLHFVSRHYPAFYLTLNLCVALLHLCPCLTILYGRRTGSQIEKEWITSATPQRNLSRAGRSYTVLPERIHRDQGFKRYCHASSFYNQLQSMYYEAWCTKPNLGSRHFSVTGLERTFSGLGRPNNTGTVVTGMERTLSGLGRSDSQCFQDKLSGW